MATYKPKRKTTSGVEEVKLPYSILTGTPTVDSALNSTSTNAVQNKVVNTALNNKANSNEVVKLTGNQTIAGSKTFSSSALLNGGAVVAKGQNIKFSANNFPYVQLQPTDTSTGNTSAVVINLPRTSGTLALTSDIPSTSNTQQLYRHDIRLYGEDGGNWEAEVFITAYNTINRAMTEAEIYEYLNNGNTNIFNATGYAYSGSDRIYLSVYRVAYWNDGQNNIAICAIGGEWFTEYMELTAYVEVNDTFDYEY